MKNYQYPAVIIILSIGLCCSTLFAKSQDGDQSALERTKAAYEMQREAYQLLFLTNQELCREAKKLHDLCPFSAPISSAYITDSLCSNDGLKPTQVRASVGSTVAVKIRINEQYESSSFVGNNQKIKFFDEKKSENFFLPFKQIHTMEIIQDAGTLPSELTFRLALNQKVIIDVDSRNDSLTKTDRGFSVELSSLKKQVSDNYSCHPNFATIMARVDRKVKDVMKSMAQQSGE
ncbi:MAG: hypothetical protein OXC40_05070 [Proteobacteria bacterium]|nr:hypothetical protein [Pseudomonadota bacterium]